MPPLSRRAVLAAGLGLAALIGTAAAGSGAYAAPLQPTIHPRSDWAGGRTPTGQLAEEDVRFVIIHHSESPNTERSGSIPGRLRGFFDYHTGPKGWPDVAYNFFVDPFGEIWEGRTGSLAGPVRGDATGGSQGFAQLCCFVGDHTATPPTDAAMTAMTALVAWLATRYRIDLTAGKSIGFTSRGSNRWPKGTRVTTDPLVGHRDMSQTSCPGEALYPMIGARILPGAQALSRARVTGEAAAEQSPTAPAGTRRTVSSLPSPTPTPVPEPRVTARVATPAPAMGVAAEQAGLADRLGDLTVPLVVGAGVLGVGAVAGGVAIAQRDR